MKWIPFICRPNKTTEFLALYLPEKDVHIVKVAPYFQCGFADKSSGEPMSAPDFYMEIPGYDL